MLPVFHMYQFSTWKYDDIVKVSGCMVAIYLTASLEIRPVFNRNTVIDPFLNEKILPKLPGGKCMLVIVFIY